ncbi:SUMO-activating enzyme subunit 1A [Datura stramonium]|uniref:SUMO-activating enzyme subunit 1A n=1 Tax=Datura stramonium TaxID=4076 RepID=A0ABS8URP8_DATST|nr:SUMO-activating enzyme subunit 1A [Datura stramonium]
MERKVYSDFTLKSKKKKCFLGTLSRFQMGKEGEELTEQETAIYDRQIRVWGVDAQRSILHTNLLELGFY